MGGRVCVGAKLGLAEGARVGRAEGLGDAEGRWVGRDEVGTGDGGSRASHALTVGRDEGVGAVGVGTAVACVGIAEGAALGGFVARSSTANVCERGREGERR